MGGHGLYVWLAYGAAALVLLFNQLSPGYKRGQLVQQHLRNQRRAQE